MSVRIQMRRDTAANWTANNPILAAGEMGLDTTNNTWKIGDGAKTWSLLTYSNATFGPSSLTGNTTIPVLSISQVGSGPALLVEDSTSVDTDPFIITSSGDVGMGTLTPSAKLDVVGNARFSGQITSLVATSSPPLIVASTTVVTNLNADLLDGQHGSYYAPLASPALTGSPTILANTSTPALTITQTGAGAALLVEDSASIDSTPVVIDTNGRLGIGTTTPASLLHIESDAAHHVRFIKNSTDAQPVYLMFRKRRGTAAAPTIVAANDYLGITQYLAYDGASDQAVASISVQVDGTPAAGDVPTRMWFATTPAGSSTPVSRMNIASTGIVTITGTVPAVDTNTTQVATTAFVVGQGYLKSATASSTYAPLASPTLTGTPLSTTAAIGTNTTQIATTAFVNQREEFLEIALSDEITAITTGVAKVTLRAPYAMTLTQIPRSNVNTASSSGIPTVDIKVTGTTILGAAKLTIDATEKTSTTAATPTTLVTSTIADDAEITFDVTVAGTGTKGLKVIIYYRRT